MAARYADNTEAAEAFREWTGIPVFRWDVADHAACAQGVAEVEEKLGAVDILVNNAGISRDGFLHKTNAENWQTVIDVNLGSCFNMAHAVLGGMPSRRFGRIINISSINAHSGMLGVANYAAAKVGMLGFTKSLDLENASKGIRVNYICPGYIRSDLIAHISDAVMERIDSGIPVGCSGKPGEVARCVVFLAAEEAGFISGSTLSVNCGGYMA